jgi:UDP-2-acetamido-3-amino-2,3-dideoxy-glucuronate N-acetyltransferase
MIRKIEGQIAKLRKSYASKTDRETMEQRTTASFIHPKAVVETEQIGSGTRIWGFTHVSEDVIIGSNCNIGSHCYLESGVRIGDGVTIKDGNYLWAGVTICDGAFVGSQVVFTNDLRSRSPRVPYLASRFAIQDGSSVTTVGKGVSVGAGAVILEGVSLKDFCMVAAGSVVTKSVPAHALVMGLPASITGWVCCCGEKLNFDPLNDTIARCEQCLCEFAYMKGELRLQPVPADHKASA